MRVALMAGLFLALSLSGCSSGGGSSTTTAGGNPTTTPASTQSFTCKDGAGEATLVQIKSSGSGDSLQMFYQPANVVIQRNECVLWRNTMTDVRHTITSDTGQFDSGEQDWDDPDFENKFTSTGEFRYHCTIHPQMTGKVNVEPA